MTQVTSREFNQNTSAVKRTADTEVVFITDRGRPSHVLMSIDTYERLRGRGSLYDALAMPDPEDIDFEARKAQLQHRIPDFS